MLSKPNTNAERNHMPQPATITVTLTTKQAAAVIEACRLRIDEIDYAPQSPDQPASRVKADRDQRSALNEALSAVQHEMAHEVITRDTAHHTAGLMAQIRDVFQPRFQDGHPVEMD